MPIVKTALLSVSDKTGLVTFARGLAALGVKILSTGGTAKHLRDNGLEVIEVSDYTGFPEIMNGRVKTLHPKIHAGILARRGIDDKVLAEHQIDPIELLVVNLYPFQQVIKNEETTMDVAIENIDIGGPTMLRAAAKNHAFVGVIVNPTDYDIVLQELKANQKQLSDSTLYRLACKTFAHTAGYDACISNYLNGHDEHGIQDIFPEETTHQYTKIMDLRYGENPHQRAAFYRAEADTGANIATASMLQGRPLSFNNIADADTALDTVKSFLDPACVIVKHANPCGVAVSNDINTAYQRAFVCDSTSAFGGIIAINRPLSASLAKSIIEGQFVEVIVAPHVDKDALPILASKKNVRVLVTGEWVNELKTGYVGKRVHGGILMQDWDTVNVDLDDLKTVTKREPTSDEFRDLHFAWNVAKFVKSNAIVYAKNQETIGIGAGQMSRVDSARIAILKAQDAKLEIAGSSMASDAFFPFRDSIDNAAKAGVTAIIQPGGSIRDDEVITAANEHGMAMVFTGIRHFRH